MVKLVSVASKTIVNLWLSWFKYSNLVFYFFICIKPWLIFVNLSVRPDDVINMIIKHISSLIVISSYKHVYKKLVL